MGREEGVGRHERCPLVALLESMVASDTDQELRRERAGISLSIMPTVGRTANGAFEHRPIFEQVTFQIRGSGDY